MAKPEVPFYDWNACPGEGCLYQEWTATKVVVVFDSYRAERRTIAQLNAGDKALGITGVVITFKPGVIRLDHDLPSKKLNRGDTILTYAYRGEGNSAVWLKGLYVPQYGISFATYPDGSGCSRSNCEGTYLDLGQRAWWAKIKLASGAMGWIDMDDSEMDGICAF